MMKHKDEIEKQLKRTENLYGDFGKVILDTINEIRKDDNLFITKLPDIPDVIKQIKKARKKWASGKNSNAKTVRALGLPFTPSIIIAVVQSRCYITGKHSGDASGGGIIIATKDVEAYAIGWKSNGGAVTYEDGFPLVINANGVSDMDNCKLDRRDNYPWKISLSGYENSHIVTNWWAFE